MVEELRKWLDDIAPSVLPKSLFGLAVNYGRQQWSKLIRFLEDGRIEISNNLAERSIKPFVIGRNYADLAIMRSSMERSSPPPPSEPLSDIAASQKSA